jgi:hypothetical protein
MHPTGAEAPLGVGAEFATLDEAQHHVTRHFNTLVRAMAVT